eukprot:3543055-Prymnesium_polylepis.1
MKATRRWKAHAACTAWRGVAGRPRSPCRRHRVFGRAGRVPTQPGGYVSIRGRAPATTALVRGVAPLVD